MRNKNDADYYQQARKKVRAKKWFYRHFSTYAVITLFFFLMNMAVDGTRDIWWIYPAMSWGTLVLLHRFWVFGLPFTKAGTKEWEEKELARELAKMNMPLPLAEPTTSFLEEDSFNVDIDDHLELKEVSSQKEIAPNYQQDDLV